MYYLKAFFIDIFFNLNFSSAKVITEYLIVHQEVDLSCDIELYCRKGADKATPFPTLVCLYIFNGNSAYL